MTFSYPPPLNGPVMSVPTSGTVSSEIGMPQAPGTWPGQFGGSVAERVVRISALTVPAPQHERPRLTHEFRVDHGHAQI